MAHDRRSFLSPLAPLVWTACLVACGDSGTPTSKTQGTDETKTPPAIGTTDTKPDGATDTSIVGLWEVSGTDARGAYAGEIEIRQAGSDFSFVRAVRYPGVTVEDGRELHWLFRGKLRSTGGATFAAEATLKRMDFIYQRGTLRRSSADGPLALTGTFTRDETGEIEGTLAGGDTRIADTWRAKRPLPETPIFEDRRARMPSHDPPNALELQVNFALFADFHTLDVVKPYVSRPEFKAGVLGHVIDPNDRDFYRQNPNALRVLDKVIDDISLLETRARADAYRYTLTQKVELYDRDLEERFVDPDVGMVPDGGPPGVGLGQHHPSGDSALWTGVYLGAQVYRHQVTGSAVAKANAVRSLEALLTLQEITGDPTHFARTLRKAQGNPQPPWHAGTGAHAPLEWMAGGNNDMIQGLFYGYLMGWELLCEGGKTGYESMCARIRTNAKHLSDHVQLGGANAPGSQLSNQLPAAWLAAVVATDPADVLKYQTKAAGIWAVAKLVLPSTAVSTLNGVADGSGAHLTSIGDTLAIFLSRRLNLGGDAASYYRDHIDASYANLSRQRLPMWDVLKAALGSGAGPSSPALASGLSRLDEAMYPKLSHAIDRTLSPEFCMSPYPYQPWKNDWMTYPQNDRTRSLDSYPLFESRADVLYWKLGNAYTAWEGYEAPGFDFSHLYWFSRKHGLIAATD